MERLEMAVKMATTKKKVIADGSNAELRQVTVPDSPVAMAVSFCTRSPTKKPDPLLVRAHPKPFPAMDPQVLLDYHESTIVNGKPVDDTPVVKKPQGTWKRFFEVDGTGVYVSDDSELSDTELEFGELEFEGPGN
eukprot:g11342.t1